MKYDFGHEIILITVFHRTYIVRVRYCPSAAVPLNLQRHAFLYDLHVPHDRRVENARIVMGHIRIAVSQHFCDIVDGCTAGKRQRTERMSGHVHRQVFRDPADVRHFFQIGVHLLIG